MDWIVELIAIVEEAGAAIFEVYNTDFEIQSKSDESPLASRFGGASVIVAGLKALSRRSRLSLKSLRHRHFPNAPYGSATG